MEAINSNKKCKCEGQLKSSPTSSEDSATRLDEYDENSVILAFAARNKKNRFFIPSKENEVAGIRYENVMVDNGCNSALFPFPIETADASLAAYANRRYSWSIAQSKCTGSVHSPVLVLTSLLGGEFSLKLGGKVQPFKLPFLRFHLGKQSAAFLCKSGHNFSQMLEKDCKAKLQKFLDDLGENEAKERKHVLLGQSYIGKVFSAQVSDVTLFLVKSAWTSFATMLPDLFARKIREAPNLVKNFSGFDDLEDEDHDGDTDLVYVRRSWDPVEDEDE